MNNVPLCAYVALPKFPAIWNWAFWLLEVAMAAA